MTAFKGLVVSLIAFFGLTAAANAQCAAGYTQLNNVFACQLNSGGAPVITSPSTATGTVGTPFSYQITATNSPTSFGASGLPSPLTVNTGNGLISGTPTATFSGTVGLSATNGSGTGTQNLSLNISSGGGNPITASNLTNGTVPSPTTSCTTASISPPANRLVIVSVASIDPSFSTVPVVTGAGGTWTMIGTKVEAGSTNRRVTLFRDLSASPGSGALTISFAGHSQNNCAWSVDGFANTNLTGTHGSGAIVQVQSGTANATNTGFSVTLNPLASPNNAAFGFIRNSGANPVTDGLMFTDLSNQSAGVPTVAEWAINETTPNWTWPSQTVISVAMAIEVAAP